MDLGDGTIIQVNSTIIAGILILLTISSASEQSLTQSLFLSKVAGIYYLTAIIILPFAVSAVLAIIATLFRDGFANKSQLIKLRQDKLSKLKQDLCNTNDTTLQEKIRKDLEKLEKKVNWFNGYFFNYDEEQFQTKIMGYRTVSLAMMIIGFCYLTVVMFWLALV